MKEKNKVHKKNKAWNSYLQLNILSSDTRSHVKQQMMIKLTSVMIIIYETSFLTIIQQGTYNTHALNLGYAGK